MSSQRAIMDAFRGEPLRDARHLTHLGACRIAFRGAPEAAARVLFVGEDNPQSCAPEHALYPYPEGCAGHRFCHKILGLCESTYLATWRTNLCVGTWSLTAARLRAIKLRSGSWQTIVIVGRKVATAFAVLTGGKPLDPFKVQYLGNGEDEDADMLAPMLVTLPHPSGRNLVWNDARRVADARALLAEVVPEYPWGEAQ